MSRLPRPALPPLASTTTRMSWPGLRVLAFQTASKSPEREPAPAGGDKDLGAMEAYHGTAGSPLLYKDRVILYQDQFNGSFVAAFDTGRASNCGGRRARRTSAGVRRSRSMCWTTTRSS